MTLTPDEISRRALVTLADHRARTAIDLTGVDTFCIVVSTDTFTGLLTMHDQAAEGLTFEYGDDSGRVIVRLRGLLIVADPHLRVDEVRLRTELEA